MEGHNANPIAHPGAHPGLGLKSELAARGIKQNDLSAEIGILPSQLNEVLKGKRPITPELALLVGAALNVDPEHYVQLQALYNLNQARIDKSNREKIQNIKDLERIKSLIPLSYFRKQGELKGDLSQDIKHITKIHGFSNLNDLVESMSSGTGLHVHFRKSSKLSEHKSTIQSWIRYIGYLSESDNLPPFNFDCQHNLMNSLKKVFLGKDVIKNLTKVLNTNGISFIVKDKPDKAPIDGAAIWHKGRPVIAVTLRYKRFDNLIFTVYHEIGHVFRHLKDDKDASFVDSLEDVKDATATKEEEANEFARNALIAEDEWNKFVNSHSLFSDRDMTILAKKLEIPAVSVWGRLCYEQRISYSCASEHRNQNNIP